jgi:hypothetical protein
MKLSKHVGSQKICTRYETSIAVVGNVGRSQWKNPHKMTLIEWTNRFALSITGTPKATNIKMHRLTDNTTKTCCAKFGADIS